jgi:hypothetical protein
MSNIQKIAAIKIGKILGCTSGELEDGTCQPLKNSTDPDLSLEEKAAMPFAEFDKNKDPWTRDWVRLLPLVEMFDFYSNHKTWRIKFLDVINHPNKIKFIFKDDCKDLPLLLYNSDDKHQSQEMKRLQDIYLWSLPNFAQNEIIENIHHRSIEDGAIMTIRDGTGWKNKDYVRYRKEKFIAKLNSEKIPAGPRDPDIVWIDIYPQNA